MPQFLSRAWDWFRARSMAEVIAIIVLVPLVLVLVLVVASRALAAVATLAFFVVVVVLIVQLFRRRPVRKWAIAAVGSLVAVVLFSSIADAIDEAQTRQTVQGGTSETRSAEPSPLKPEETKLEYQEPEQSVEKREEQKPETAVQSDPDNDGAEDEQQQPNPAKEPTEDEPAPAPKQTDGGVHARR